VHRAKTRNCHRSGVRDPLPARRHSDRNSQCLVRNQEGGPRDGIDHTSGQGALRIGYNQVRARIT
jgi:hypothetical protein